MLVVSRVPGVKLVVWKLPGWKVLGVKLVVRKLPGVKLVVWKLVA